MSPRKTSFIFQVKGGEEAVWKRDIFLHVHHMSQRCEYVREAQENNSEIRGRIVHVQSVADPEPA